MSLQMTKNQKITSFKQYSTAGQISLPYYGPGGPKIVQKQPKLAKKTDLHGFFVLDSI